MGRIATGHSGISASFRGIGVVAFGSEAANDSFPLAAYIWHIRTLLSTCSLNSWSSLKYESGWGLEKNWGPRKFKKMTKSQRKVKSSVQMSNVNECKYQIIWLSFVVCEQSLCGQNWPNEQSSELVGGNCKIYGQWSQMINQSDHTGLITDEQVDQICLLLMSTKMLSAACSVLVS